MSSTPREIGTLIVVILKAKHLPNKRHIGKQDPYCSVTVNGEKRRTKAIKRGGQHPEWDEEVRFTLYEDVEDELARTVKGDDTPPPPPPKNNKSLKKIKGGKIMKVCCFADDPREPDLIGETNVDLTEVLTKGETDEWFTLMNKDKFSGEVYLELTFWSNEPPPEKTLIPKPSKSNKQYGGPGSFIPTDEVPSVLQTGNSGQSRIASTSSLYEHSRRSSDAVPSSLRASSSLAKLDLYVPPYEQKNRISPIDNLTNGFGEFGVSDLHRRRESFPPPHGGYTPRPSSSIGFSTLSTHTSYGYEQGMASDAASTFSYDRPITPTAHSSLHQLNPSPTYPVQPSYQPPYEQHPYEAGPAGYAAPPPARGPRYSIPTSSSGFVPLSSHSSFVPLSSFPSDPSGFGAHPSTSIGYSPSPFNPQSGFMPTPTQTPAPSNFAPLPPSSSASFHAYQPFPPSQTQSFQYQYPVPQSTSAPPQQFAPQPPPSVPPVSHSAPPQPPYQGYSTPSPSHDIPPPPLPPSSISLSSSLGASSRPLPQQPQNYGQQTQPYTLPVSGNSQQQIGSYSPTGAGAVAFPAANPYQSVPPPPPPPPPSHIQTQTYMNGQSVTPGPPPPLPPTSQFHTQPPPRHRSSLPQPPTNHPPQSQQSLYQAVPPPPLADLSQHIQPSHQTLPLSHSSTQNTYPGPPPRPPALDGQSRWFPPNDVGQQTNGAYSQQGQGWS